MSHDIMVTLGSSDGQMFEVEESVAQQFKTVRSMIEDTGTEDIIHLPNVESTILAKMIEYAKYHLDARESSDLKPAVPEDDIEKWNDEFIKVDQTTLFNLILAANYLDYAKLLDLGCQTVADMMKDNSAEEVRKTFNIKNDFTPEEEEEIKRENAWAFE